MKFFLITGLMMTLATLAVAPLARAGQTHMQDLAADLNKDGTVTLLELREYNRDQRSS
ncbi:MAG TPA: hypothetical protein VLS96_01020 [Nodosilinea sp.]|nr:hypothetical protein [Nodosilinea sp.]